MLRGSIKGFMEKTLKEKSINIFDLKGGHILELDVTAVKHNGRDYLDYVNKQLVQGEPLWKVKSLLEIIYLKWMLV